MSPLMWLFATCHTIVAAVDALYVLRFSSQLMAFNLMYTSYLASLYL